MNRHEPPSWLGPTAGVAAAATIVSSIVAGAGPVRALRLAGACVGLVALPLAFIPFALLQRRGKPNQGRSYMSTTRLVDSGLYRVVRHPQYLAYVLFMVAFALLAQRALVSALAVLAAGLLYAVAVYEEGSCGDRFGPAYQNYAAAVPRFNLLAGLLRMLSRRRR